MTHEPLKHARLAACLRARGRAPSGVAVFDEIDSTNAWLLACDDPKVRACVADRQRQGRGTRGRAWVSPGGVNAYVSVRAVLRIEHLAGLSLAVGVAVAQGLAQWGAGDVALKWPNDLWLEDRKLGGCLIETRPEQAGEWRVVVGVGLNYGLDPLTLGAVGQPAADLTERVPWVEGSRHRLVAVVIDALWGLLEDWPARRADWLARWSVYDALYERPVQWRRGEEELKTGRALGIDEAGRLRLQSDTESLWLDVGDVSVRLPS